MSRTSYQRKRRSGLSGLALGLLLAAGMRLYSRRVLVRQPGHEGIEDPEISRAYGWVSSMPQMVWLRSFLAERAIAAVSGGHAVDLGCGPGLLVMELARRAPKLYVTGVDLSTDMLSSASIQAEQACLGEQVDFRQGDAGNIPFPDGSLDLVISTLSLHHWSDPVAVFNEIERVLKPGGAFLIFDLRRDLSAPFYLLLWFATQFVVPTPLHRINEPISSRNAAYTPMETVALAEQSRLAGWRVTPGPLWVLLEGRKPRLAE